MNRKRTPSIALMFAIALGAGLARAADSPVHTAPGDYAAMKANCTSIAVAARAQCVKVAKSKDNAKPKDSLWHCEDLSSREERECIIRELEGTHAGNGEPVATVPQPR